MILLVSFWDDIVEALEDLVCCFRRDDLDDDDDEYYRKRHRKRKRKRVKWRIFVPFLARRRRIWTGKRNGRRTDRKCKDAVVESIVSQQEILEAMYGQAPSVWQVYRRVKDRHGA